MTLNNSSVDKIKHYFSGLYSSIRFWWVVFGILAMEIVSFAGFNFPILNAAVCIVIIIGTFIFALRKLHYGILLLFAELVVGSKGYLFELSIAGFPLSVRLGMFFAVFLAFLIWIIRDKEIRFFQWTLWKPYTAVACVLLMGAFVGILFGNTPKNIFFDANGYLYFALILPFVQSVRSQKDIQQLLAVMLAAGTAVIIKTLLLLFFFSKVDLWPYSMAGIYRWIRDTGVGEVTRMKFGFYRIFFQSHIYTVFIFFFLGTWFALAASGKRSIQQVFKNRYVAWTYILFAFSLLTIFLVYSRSFWVGSIAAIGVAFVWFFLQEKMSMRRITGILLVFLFTFVIDYGVALGIVNFPIPGAGKIDASALLTERTKNLGNEEAASSRMSLLKPLATASLNSPIFGSGLGSTVTYKSSDPRIKTEENPAGWYTTYAFEWGYIDLLYKFGVIGILTFGYLAVMILKHGLSRMKHGDIVHNETLGLLFGFVALLGTHFFTPYLNHPLGIGFVLLVSVVVTMQPASRVEEAEAEEQEEVTVVAEASI